MRVAEEVLTRDERSYYRRQIRASHEIHVRASMHDHNEDFMHWIEQPILDGQVDVDTTRVPERQLTLELFDPRAKFGGRSFADNFVCVEYGVEVPELHKIVWHPVFFGPITKLTPNDGVTAVEAQSKEILLQEPVVWGRFIRSVGLGGNAIRVWVIQKAEHNHNEIQGIEAIGPIKGGTWRVVLGKHRTDPIDWDANAATVEAAIEALPNIGAGNVDVTGGPLNNRPFHVEWIGTKANDTPGDAEIQDNTLTFDDDIRYAGKFIRRLLREAGERKFHFGNFGKHRLPKNFKLPKQPESLWSVVQRVVKAVNKHTGHPWRIFYDGAGVLRVEHTANGFKFDERVVINAPVTEYSLEGFRNTEIVAINRGNEARPVKPELVTLPKRNPMSPYHLRRNGKKRYLVNRIDNPHVRSPHQAKKVGEAQLHHDSTEHVEVTFDSLPIPVLVPGSQCRLVIDDEQRIFHVDKFTLPLTSNTPMSVGYNRRTFTRGKRNRHAF